MRKDVVHSLERNVKLEACQCVLPCLLTPPPPTGTGGSAESVRVPPRLEAEVKSRQQKSPNRVTRWQLHPSTLPASRNECTLRCLVAPSTFGNFGVTLKCDAMPAAGDNVVIANSKEA